ncbi:histone deacetylase hdt1 [Nicotiana attenuata]|uniref:Histone deacetylase hdt1 n=1 Tax=Nicotiana attenuata TaxID=49451 RepID=A0A1J6KVX3_NICAT|nr:histone deacetylase hdt1 [Nicotiana attenuata]
MEFWGVEVKAGESLKVRPELYKLIHISQAALGEVKDAKEAKNVPLRVTVGENNYVIGTLSAEERPQLMFDLVFEKEFELSHGWKNGSVYFIGYTADDPTYPLLKTIQLFCYQMIMGCTSYWFSSCIVFLDFTFLVVSSVCTDEIDSEDEDSEDEENVLAALNGKLEEQKADVKDVKPVTKEAAPTKAKAAVAEPKKAESDDDDDDSDDEDDSDEAEDGMDSDGPEGMDFSDDSEDDDDDSEEDESEEETPKKNKRPAPPAKAGFAKKAKQATPDKSGGKKGPATPAFAKQNGKPAATNGNKGKGQSPKSGGQFSGKSSNNKNFSGQQKGGFKGKHGKK